MVTGAILLLTLGIGDFYKKHKDILPIYRGRIKERLFNEWVNLSDPFFENNISLPSALKKVSDL
jgi:hypothetical protein